MYQTVDKHTYSCPHTRFRGWKMLQTCWDLSSRSLTGGHVGRLLRYTSAHVNTHHTSSSCRLLDTETLWHLGSIFTRAVRCGAQIIRPQLRPPSALPFTPTVRCYGRPSFLSFKPVRQTTPSDSRLRPRFHSRRSAVACTARPLRLHFCTMEADRSGTPFTNKELYLYLIVFVASFLQHIVHCRCLSVAVTTRGWNM